MEAHEIPDLEYMHELILVMSVFCKQINNYEWAGGYFIFIYLYVHNSPYLFVYGDDRVIFIREQMMFQVGQEMHSGGEWAQSTRGIYKCFT